MLYKFELWSTHSGIYCEINNPFEWFAYFSDHWSSFRRIIIIYVISSGNSLFLLFLNDFQLYQVQFMWWLHRGGGWRKRSSSIVIHKCFKVSFCHYVEYVLCRTWEIIWKARLSWICIKLVIIGVFLYRLIPWSKELRVRVGTFAEQHRITLLFLHRGLVWSWYWDRYFGILATLPCGGPLDRTFPAISVWKTNLRYHGSW